MCLRPQWKHPNLTLKFHIVCFALSQATNRYIKSEMKRLIIITLLGKLNEHIYWMNTTFRLLLKIPMVTFYIGVPKGCKWYICIPCWHANEKKNIRENCNTVLNGILEIIVQLITVERLKFSVLIFYPLNS